MTAARALWDDVSMDGWDGYAASRRRITQGWVDADVRNAVVLTGDVHRNCGAGVPAVTVSVPAVLVKA